MKLRWFSAIVTCAAIAMAPIANPLSSICSAQEKPKVATKTADVTAEDTSVLVVAINSLETFLPNIQHLVRNAAGGAIAGPMAAAVNQYTGGLDKNRPVGLFVDLDDAGQPRPVGCLPVNDLKVFFEQLSIFGEPTDLGNGLYEFSFGSPIYAKKAGNWLYVAQSEDALDGIAEKKAAGLAKMLQSYDLRIQLNPKSIPAEMVDFFVSQMENGLEQAMAAQRQDMDPDEAAATQAASEQMIAQMKEAIDGTEKLVVGVAVNKAEKKTVLDVLSQFVDGSKFAKQVLKAKTSKTAFSAIPQLGSMLTARSLQLVDTADLAQLERTIESSIKAAYKAIDEKATNPNSAAKAKELINRMVDILMESAKQGKLDSAVDISVDGDLGIVASVAVADGVKVEALASDIAKELVNEKGPIQMRIGTGKHAGMNLHKASFKLPPEADDSARKIFGDTATLAIATSPKVVHLALGKNCDALLKSAIDRAASKPSEPAEMLEVRLALSQLLNFVHAIESNPISEAMLSAATSGNDRILVDSSTIERGYVVRLSLDDGVVKAIAAGAKAGQGAGGGF
ncbi:MAG: hypothetical protein ABL921_01025 [Pirellula sp.]